MGVIISAKHYVAGVLADADTAVLSSPDGLFGVKNQSTGAVIVANNTQLVKVGDGQYTYDITIPTGESVVYYVKFTKDGVSDYIYGSVSNTDKQIDLISTVAGMLSNSYASYYDVEAYFSSRLNADAWDLATERNKIKALLMACRDIENLRFNGVKYRSGLPGSEMFQRLEWPRYPEASDPFMLGIPHLMYDGNSYSWLDVNGNPTIPNLLKLAQCEQAYFLLNNMRGVDKRAGVRAQGISKFTVDNLVEEYVSGSKVYEIALRYLKKMNAIYDGGRMLRG